MQLQHEFTLPIPPDQAWATLLDVERVAPCMPGATLDHVDGDEFSGRVTLKVGPLRLTYRGDARIKEKDTEQRRLVIAAAGQEARGSGTAEATVTASLEPTADGTRVALLTDLALTGRPAQFGRGLVSEVAGTVIGQFAERLSHEMRNGGEPEQTLEAAPEPEPARGDAAGTSTGTSTETAAKLTGTESPTAPDDSLDVLTLLRSTVGTRGLVALGAVTGVVIAFLLGRRGPRATPGSHPGMQAPQPQLPAVYVIDAGKR